ncbi:hypothetical protein [Kibdelosporangium aridum]|uniref:hypothetical protein n=1 Tax=Kibdelosporangium aridum TaxID=2030 RepID=UPI0035E7E341
MRSRATIVFRVDDSASTWICALGTQVLLGDRASWNLEDKLPELLRELAVRADELRYAEKREHAPRRPTRGGRTRRTTGP